MALWLLLPPVEQLRDFLAGRSGRPLQPLSSRVSRRLCAGLGGPTMCPRRRRWHRRLRVPTWLVRSSAWPFQCFEHLRAVSNDVAVCSGWSTSLMMCVAGGSTSDDELATCTAQPGTAAAEDGRACTAEVASINDGCPAPAQGERVPSSCPPACAAVFVPWWSQCGAWFGGGMDANGMHAEFAAFSTRCAAEGGGGPGPGGGH